MSTKEIVKPAAVPFDAGLELPVVEAEGGLKEAAASLAMTCKALSHPVRIQIVRYLMGQKECVCKSIVDQFDLAQSTISQHLKVLKKCGLVQGEVEGTSVCYCLNRPNLQRFKWLLNSLIDESRYDIITKI